MNSNKRLSPKKDDNRKQNKKAIRTVAKAVKRTSKQSKTRSELLVTIAFYVLVAAYGALCFYLFYNQSLQGTVPDNHYFESDLPYHISMVVDDGWYYSLTAFVYLALYKITSGGTVLIALFLALVAAGTVVATKKLMDKMFPGEGVITYGAALAMNLVMPFFIKWAGMYRYVSYQSGNVWHNSTYICMRLFAVIFLCFYIDYEKRYKERGLNVKEWIVLTVLLALTTFVKPSFLTVFAPALAIKLLWDLIKNKIKFVRVLIMGLTVVPSLGVMLWQNSVLFGNSSENGFKISFMETFSLHADHPKITVLLSLAFPIVVFVSDLILRGKFWKDSTYVFSLIMTVIGFGMAILLVETGSRSRDGNFLWGYCLAMFILYITSFKRWYGFLKNKKWIAGGIGGAVLVYQIVCGAIFFTRLMAGETYFMIG